jgi:signal transduction histidine kinase
LIYLARGEPKETIKSFRIALEIAVKIQSDKEQSRILLNTALYENEYGQVQTAIQYHFKSIDKAIQIDDKYLNAYNKCFIGKCYTKLKQYDSVSWYFDESIRIFKELNSINQIAMVYNQYAEYFNSINEYYKAIYYAEKADSLGKEIGNKFMMMEAAYFISNAYLGLKKFESALKYKTIYYNLSDTLKNESNTKSIAHIEDKHKYENELKDIKLQNEKQLSNNKMILTIVIGIALILVILLIVFIFVYRWKAKHSELLVEKNIKISELNSQLSELNKSKDKFFTLIAHDLKSPLTGILGLTKILSDELSSLSNDELKEFSKCLKDSAENLNNLLENLLDWSRMQRGLISFEPEVCDLHLIVENNILVLNDYLKQKEILVINNIPMNLHVYADIQMLNAVLRNLISNSLKFSYRKGRVEIGIETIINKKEITESHNSNEVIIYIKDYGIGIPDKLLKKLFSIDEKVSQPGTEGEPSTGLGLHLSKDFIEKHNGRIWAVSKVGMGSTFYFSIFKSDSNK